jgi:hypothetical protein
VKVDDVIWFIADEPGRKRTDICEHFHISEATCAHRIKKAGDNLRRTRKSSGKPYKYYVTRAGRKLINAQVDAEVTP